MAHLPTTSIQSICKHKAWRLLSDGMSNLGSSHSETEKPLYTTSWQTRSSGDSLLLQQLAQNAV